MKNNNNNVKSQASPVDGKKKNKKDNVVRKGLPKSKGMYPGDFGRQMSQVTRYGYGATLRMYPEVVNFTEVYMNPFSIKEARLPYLPILSSKAYRTVASGNGAIGTNGFGFITAQPMNGSTNDLTSIWYSSSAFTAVAIAQSGTGVSSTTSTKSPYTNASFTWNTTNSLAVRCVAFGIRVRNVGTVLNSAGEWSACQINPKLTCNAFDVAGVRKVQGYKQDQFADRNWKSYNRMITSRFDAEFLQYNSAWAAFNPSASSDENSNYMGVVVTGTAGQAFEWEVVGHYEAVGPNLDIEKVGVVDESNANLVVTQGLKMRHKDNSTVDHLSPQRNEDSSGKVMNFLKSATKRLIPIIGDLTGTSNIVKAISDFIG